MLETIVPVKGNDDRREIPPTLVLLRCPKENFDLVNQLVGFDVRTLASNVHMKFHEWVICIKHDLSMEPMDSPGYTTNQSHGDVHYDR